MVRLSHQVAELDEPPAVVVNPLANAPIRALRVNPKLLLAPNGPLSYRLPTQESCWILSV